jgi:hypothetical protein
VEKNRISNAQIETVVYAMARFNGPPLPNGADSQIPKGLNDILLQVFAGICIDSRRVALRFADLDF